MNIKLFPKKEFYISVSEGKLGLETFVSEDINQLHPANKRLLVSFLLSIAKDLSEENVSNKAIK